MVEGVLVALDVGTSKVCALIGEIGRDGRLTVMGHGTVPSSGLKKGVVVNIDQTVRSIAESVERAERLSGWKIDKAFVGVGGAQIESLNSTGQVAVSAHTREVAREDIRRAIEVARAVAIPTNREVLHVERDEDSFDHSLPQMKCRRIRATLLKIRNPKVIRATRYRSRLSRSPMKVRMTAMIAFVTKPLMKIRLS